MTKFAAKFVYGKHFRDPLVERPGNFSGLESNFQIKIYKIKLQVLANKPVHFRSFFLADRFII